MPPWPGGPAAEAERAPPGAAVLLLRAPGARLHREAPGDRRHRREDRQAPILLADGLEGDEPRAARERRVEERRLGREMLEAENRLVPARLAVFRRLQLLHLHDELAVPCLAKRRAG